LAQQIKVYQCHHCEFQTMIPSGYCSCCRRKNSFDEIEVEGKGKIFSYTTVYVSEERLQSEVPYLLAIIECKGGLRLLGRLDQSNMDSIQIGTDVELIGWRDEAPIFHKIID
jgi:uncharacterized OB-fold protein